MNNGDQTMTKPLFETREQLDASHKLAKHFGLWWTRSLREGEIAGLVGMTADEIKEVCDRAAARDIEAGYDESNWRSDPTPDYRTGAYSSGRTSWSALPNGGATIRIHRPAGVVLVARWHLGELLLSVHESAAVRYRHVAALIHALSALDPKAEAKVWRALGDHPALFARLIEEEREWEAHAAEWEGRATVDPWQWRSSLEVA